MRQRIENMLRDMPDLRRAKTYLIADAVGISRSKLQRELRKDGVGCQELIDAERRRRLESMRRTGTLPASVTDTALALGFSAANSLRVAFHRWYGGAPTSRGIQAGTKGWLRRSELRRGAAA